MPLLARRVPVVVLDFPDMPKIPTYTAQRSIVTGSTAVHADAGSFGADAYGALAGLGRQIQQSGDQVQHAMQQQRVRAEKDGLRWGQEALTQLQAEADEKLFEFQEREDGDAAFKEWSDKRLSEYMGNAPTGDSGRWFRLQAAQDLNRGFSALRRTSAKVKVDKILGGFDNAVAFEAARYGKVLDNPELSIDPHGEYKDQIERTRSVLTAQLSGLAPRQLQAKLEESAIQYVYGAINANSPAMARELVDEYVTDEVKKNRLLDEIKRTENAINAVNATGDALFVQEQLKRAQKGESYVLPNRAQFGSDSDFKRTMANFSDANTANAFANEADGLTAVQREARRAELFSSGKISSDADDAIRRQNKGLADLERDDFVAARITSSSAASKAYQQVQRARSDVAAAQKDGDEERMAVAASNAEAATGTLFEMMMNDQRGVPETAWRVLPNAMAEQALEVIKNAKPSEKMAAIRSVFDDIPEKFVAYAYNDLERRAGNDAGKLINRALIQQRDNPIGAELAGALAAWPKSKVDRKPIWKDEALDKAITASSSYQALLSMRGDRAENQETLSDYRQLMTAWAVERYPDKTASEAAELAAKDVFGRDAAVFSVNGNTVVIPKTTGLDPDFAAANLKMALGLVPLEQIAKFQTGEMSVGGEKLTAEMIDRHYGARVDATLREGLFIPIGERGVQLNPLRHGWAAMLMNQWERAKQNPTDYYMRSALWDNGFFRLTADQKAVTLHYRNRDGQSTQVVDKDGNPFFIELAALPQYTASQRTYGSMGGPGPITATVGEVQATKQPTPDQAKSMVNPWKVGRR